MRTFISPIVGDGKTPDTAYRAKVVQELKDAGVWTDSPSLIPHNKDGTPASTWSLTQIDFDRLPITKGLPEVVSLYQQIMAVGEAHVAKFADVVEIPDAVDEKGATDLNAKLAALGVKTALTAKDVVVDVLVNELQSMLVPDEDPVIG